VSIISLLLEIKRNQFDTKYVFHLAKVKFAPGKNKTNHVQGGKQRWGSRRKMLVFVRRNLKACSKSMKIEQKFTIILSNLTLNLLLKKVCMMHIK
jgi:hypothetical protein